MNNLPTREEIAEIISDVYGRLPDRSLYPSTYRMADALLARLRPAFERLDNLLWVTDNQQKDIDVIAAQRDALRASLARKDEALRACVGALSSIVCNDPEDAEIVRAALQRLKENG